MTGLTLAAAIAGALLTIGSFCYALWRRILRPATRGVRWLADTLGDLHTTDVGVLGGTVTDNNRQLIEIRKSLGELGQALTVTAVEAQRREDRVVALAHDVATQLGYAAVTLDGFDIRLERLESHPALQRAA